MKGKARQRPGVFVVVVVVADAPPGRGWRASGEEEKRRAASGGGSTGQESWKVRRWSVSAAWSRRLWLMHVAQPSSWLGRLSPIGGMMLPLARAADRAVAGRADGGGDGCVCRRSGEAPALAADATM